MFIRRMITFITVIVLCLISSVPVYSAESPTDELHIFDKSPGISFNGVSLIPLTDFFKAYGAKIEQDDSLKVITVSYGIDKTTGSNKYFKFQLNNKYALFGIQEVYMKAPPVSYKGKIYIPCRVVAEEMGATVNWTGKEVYISFPGTPAKSFVFPINMKPDLSLLPKLPQPRIIDPFTTGDISYNKSLGVDSVRRIYITSGQYPTSNDWNYLNSRISGIFEAVSLNSDMAFTLVKSNVRDKCGNYLHIYMPLSKNYCENIPNQSGEFAGWYQRQRIAGIVASQLAPIAQTVYLMCFNNELKPGLWEQYTDGIVVTLVAADKSMLSLELPFISYKLGNTTMYTPAVTTDGALLKTYRVYINGNYLGTGTDNNNWDGSFDGQIGKFLKQPVTKPINPYFNVVNYPYNKSFYEQGIWK